MDPEKPTSPGGFTARIVGVLCGLLLLYVLSIGPATYYIQLHPQIFTTAYFPVTNITKKSPELSRALNSYCEFWRRFALARMERSQKRKHENSN